MFGPVWDFKLIFRMMNLVGLSAGSVPYDI